MARNGIILIRKIADAPVIMGISKPARPNPHAMRALDGQIKDLDKAEQQFQVILNTLTSIPGISKVYPAGIIVEIDNIRRFNSQASVAKYAGLIWIQHQSGSFDAQHTKLIKSGNCYLRYYLLEAANSVRICDSEFRRYYDL